MPALVSVLFVVLLWLALPGVLWGQGPPEFTKKMLEAGIIPKGGTLGSFKWCGDGSFDRTLSAYYSRVAQTSQDIEPHPTPPPTPPARYVAKPGVRFKQYSKSDLYESPESVCARAMFISFVRWVITVIMGIIHLLGLLTFIWLIALYGVEGSNPQTVAFARSGFQNVFTGFILAAGVWLFFEILVEVLFGMSLDLLGFFRPVAF